MQPQCNPSATPVPTPFPTLIAHFLLKPRSKVPGADPESHKHLIMPPKRFGPVTERQEEQRAYQARLKETKLRHQVVNAVRGDSQPTAFSKVQGRFLPVWGQREKLQHADGTLTDAGRIYHEHVGEEQPLMYAYEHGLFSDKFVMGYKGKKVTVRQWKDGAWQVTKEGEAYYKHNK